MFTFSFSAYFECSRCKESLVVENIKGKIQEPIKCQRSECGAVQSMVLVHNRCLFSGKQILKVQETPGRIKSVFSIPLRLFVCLFVRFCTGWTNSACCHCLCVRFARGCCTAWGQARVDRYLSGFSHSSQQSHATYQKPISHLY
jgi:MCM OB domain